jgi:hypothetical protein
MVKVEPFFVISLPNVIWILLPSGSAASTTGSATEMCLPDM